ncbi:ATP-binding protein [Chlorobium ferrooxidans]|uniref:Divergent AAA region n=1 Tax=Chlorobium ferrooxidans DSM 13031 TaxID=377431 RepID=Q0YTH5_9CHLB|nr:ATP-binding protein [Chlorobium ferrooxidans]EAT59654.1 Divergent AAA region [Chlorobium ferrooxidans DSM 13031]
MKEFELRQIISRAESESLDFKAEGYDLKGSRNAFVKDVLAMANTPRDVTAYIVFGVRWTPESGSTVVGMSCQLDDVELQDAFGNGRVQPNPRFVYTPIEFDGKQIGILEIPVEKDGPYTPVKDYDGLQAGVVYYRRGTQNDRAVGSELRRIWTWFQNGDVGIPEGQSEDTWLRFFDAVHHFEYGTKYLLALDYVSSIASAPVHALGIPPWRAVIDFDPKSDISGFLSCIGGSISRHRVIHRVVRGEYRVQPEPGTHWFFARGLYGRSETLAVGNHRDWLKSYKREISIQLDRLARDISPSPVVAMLLWSNPTLSNHLRTLIEELYGAFGDTVEVVVVSIDAPSFESIAEDAGATFVKMSFRCLCNGIAVHYADQQNANDDRCVLPSLSGAPIEVDASDFLWLSEDLELVHRNSGLKGNDDPANFRRGAEVSWRNLHLRHDCDRDCTQLLRRQIEADLQRRQTIRINLYHLPGSGGSTVGRRVAWDLHGSIPVCILKSCSPQDTAERISKIAALTESSILVIVDGGQHSEREIDDLYEFLKANHTPVVLLQVLRRFQSQKPGNRQFWLDSQLTDAEADRFRDAYGKEVPFKKVQLNELARHRNNPQRNAFFFGLTAFGKDFRGLELYVDRRIGSLTEKQQRILVYIAMAHYYGQQSVPVQAFARLLGLPQSKTIDFHAAFADNKSPALDLLVEMEPGEWRTAHHLIALEIMQQVMVPIDNQQRDAVWRQALSTRGKDFADFCRGDERTSSDRLLELVRRVFVYRDNIEVLGTERAAQRRFAQLVEDIPSSNGKIDLLRHLTTCFPLEAHFHAHLGRFLGLNGEYDEALKCIDFAISLQSSDHILHHMRGMVLRQKLKADWDAGATVAQIVETAKDASESFEIARNLRSDMEHGYISEVQMLIDLVDRAGNHRQDVIREVLARPETNPFLKQALERAEDLLDQVQHLFAGEDPSKYVLECRARLQRIYGNYQTALQAWDSLLSRPEVAKSAVRRQLVWTILRRRDGVWEKLTDKETDRIRTLLEDNLEEDVYDTTSLRLWLRVIRQSHTPPSLDSIIEKVSYWKVNTGALDAAYYLYVLHTLRALKGSNQGAADAERALEECRMLARFRRDRTRSFEWVGRGDGVATLIHQSQLGEWDGDFWELTNSLDRINGRIASIDGPQKGLIELDGGVFAFFVPARAGVLFGKDENVPITCFLGFSYDGPRAWGVQRIDA